MIIYKQHHKNTTKTLWANSNIHKKYRNDITATTKKNNKNNSITTKHKLKYQNNDQKYTINIEYHEKWHNTQVTKQTKLQLNNINCIKYTNDNKTTPKKNNKKNSITTTKNDTHQNNEQNYTKKKTLTVNTGCHHKWQYTNNTKNLKRTM